MTYADQWANRHDGACEQEKRRHMNNYDFMSSIAECPDCHCYRRWLEGQLEECHHALRALLPKGEWWGLTFNQRYEKIRHILPPKGAE